MSSRRSVRRELTVLTAAISGVASAAHRFVREIRREPAFRLVDGDAFAPRGRDALILANPAHVEIACSGIREIQAADARRRRHRRVLGEIDADLARTEQVEQRELLAVIRTRRVSEPWPDPAMRLGDDGLGRERLV